MPVRKAQGHETSQSNQISAIPKRLRTLRKAAGYGSAAEFARAVQVNPISYQHNENGRRNLSKDRAKKYAPFLNVDWKVLLDDDASPPANVSAKQAPVKFSNPTRKWSRMTLDEFQVWDSPGQETWQLIDGEPSAMAPTTETHGLIQAELGALLRNHLLDQRSPCRVVTAPGVVPRIRSGMNFRIPDLGVTCSSPSQQTVVAEPVLLVEILSPSNEVETRANVWAYTTIPSVQEILLVRSSRMEAELLRRGEDGNWPAESLTVNKDATLALDSIGFTTPLAALYRTTGLRR